MTTHTITQERLHIFVTQLLVLQYLLGHTSQVDGSLVPFVVPEVISLTTTKGQGIL